MFEELKIRVEYVAFSERRVIYMFRIFGKLWYVDNKDVLEELKVTDKLCDELLKKLDAQRQRDIEFSLQLETFLKEYAEFTDQDFEKIRKKTQFKKLEES